LEPGSIRSSRKKVVSVAEDAAASLPDLRRAARRGLTVFFVVLVPLTAIFQAITIATAMLRGFLP
jgi:hypothetical protein